MASITSDLSTGYHGQRGAKLEMIPYNREFLANSEARL
jgi:hypothetical protein